MLRALRKKCPNTELFLVRIFPHSDQKNLLIWTLVSVIDTFLMTDNHLLFRRNLLEKT